MGILDNTFKAIDSKLNNITGKAVSGINNKYLRAGAQNLLDTFLPGFGGGTPDFRDNAYADLINARVAQTAAEQNNVIAQAVMSETNESLKSNYDWRARLRPKNGGADKFYSSLGNADYLLRPIKESGGLVWQYTPTIFLSGTADYNQALMQGMNYPINTFTNSRAPDIPVTADFTANNAYEARYLLAVMTFLRVCTKAYFGDTAVASGDYGTPPPVLLFEYLGDHGFNKVPVVVGSYQMSLPDDVDYVPVVFRDEITYVPSKSNITVNLIPTYTPHKIRRKFDLQGITNGATYKDGFI